mmetsp:Transcript_17275/g.42924  ORF Transcript_17275/g.42924 Transcript_17275/m.42924 type:complete len:208 (-) Transcript_17275:240-863(-)
MLVRAMPPAHSEKRMRRPTAARQFNTQASSPCCTRSTNSRSSSPSSYSSRFLKPSFRSLLLTRWGPPSFEFCRDQRVPWLSPRSAPASPAGVADEAPVPLLACRIGVLKPPVVGAGVRAAADEPVEFRLEVTRVGELWSRDAPSPVWEPRRGPIIRFLDSTRFNIVFSSTSLCRDGNANIENAEGKGCEKVVPGEDEYRMMILILRR